MDSADNRLHRRRSPFVTVLAWTFIVVSGFATLIALVQNVMVNVVFPVDAMSSTAGAGMEQDAPPFLQLMTGGLRLFFAAFLLLSAIALVSAIGLLKRQNWARLMFVALMAFGIVWNIGALFFQYTVFSSMPPPAPDTPLQFRAEFEAMQRGILLFSSFVAVAFSLLFAWVVQRLTSPTITAEFRSKQSPRTWARDWRSG